MRRKAQKKRKSWGASAKTQIRTQLQKDERKAEREAKAAGHVEAAMRDAAAPWPKTEAELGDYIRGLVTGAHTYGTCVYAASLSATATFNYVCGTLGMTGFQASCADFDVIRRTRGIKGPFILLKGEDALYPQFNLQQRLREAILGWQPWLGEQAEKLLAEKTHAHPEVEAHWRQLVAAGNLAKKAKAFRKKTLSDYATKPPTKAARRRK